MKHKKQHFVTAAYLQSWCDPNTPDDHDPYVWLVSVEDQEMHNKSPKNVFSGSDFYTVYDNDGNRILELEHQLHSIEDNFLKARRLIQELKPLSDKHEEALLLFIVTSFSRTKFQKADQSSIWDELLELYDNLGISQKMPNLYKEIENLRNQPMPFFLTNFTNITLSVLKQMNLSILVTSGSTGFITSDNPVVWFDPSIFMPDVPLTFFGLGSPYLTILFPVTPSHLVQLSWDGKDSYLFLDSNPIVEHQLVDEINKMVAAYADEFVITNTNFYESSWFEQDI